MAPPKTVGEALEALSRDGIEWVDLQVTDLAGKLHHVTIHISMVDEDTLSEGFGKLDGSSVAGFSTIDDSDLVLKPVVETYAVLPWHEATARFLTQVYWNLGRGRFPRDPRWVSERVEELLAGEGLKAYTSVEPEFFILDGIEFKVSMGESYYRLYSSEATWSQDEYRGIR
ncbi:MAG: glutamine synthetase beta-grasp domain-containing protein, partial [Desulfurococcales archaeon]|nr:glutamine synthetase beta-grasp domain-containing protein [Desulfurococcales archaeon]